MAGKSETTGKGLAQSWASPGSTMAMKSVPAWVAAARSDGWSPTIRTRTGSEARRVTYSVTMSPLLLGLPSIATRNLSIPLASMIRRSSSVGVAEAKATGRSSVSRKIESAVEEQGGDHLLLHDLPESNSHLLDPLVGRLGSDHFGLAG
jgi:hypothetical protein